MRKSKLILGIVIAILGGSIMLDSVISGTVHFSGKLNEDFQTWNIALQAPQTSPKTSFFSVQEGQRLSLWFRYLNKPVGNKNLKIAAALIDEDENVIKEFIKDIRFSYLGEGAKKIRFLKIGAYPVQKEFRGYLRYELDGTWAPTNISALILRKSPPLRLPLKQICFFVVGIVALIVGLETIAKYFRKRKTFRPA